MKCKINLFTDDNVVWFSGKDIELVFNVIHRELKSVYQRLIFDKLDGTKMKAMIVSSKEFNEINCHAESIIGFVSEFKYLDIVIDKNLKFLKHGLVKKLGKKRGF